jgi:hypothetical protein
MGDETLSASEAGIGSAAAASARALRYQPLLSRVQQESTVKKARLLQYWLSLSDDGLPDYRRFNALDIPDLLGDLAVVQVERPGPRFRFRLYGTRVADVRGKDLTGLCVGDPGVFSDDLNRIYLQGYQQVEASGEPVFKIVPYELQRNSVGNYHRLLLPFTDSVRGTGVCDVILLSFESVPLSKT